MKTNLTEANIFLAVDYVNETFPRIKNEPISGTEFMISVGSYQDSEPGSIVFEIYRNRFQTKDTLGCVVKRIFPMLGLKYVRTCTNDTETYEWTISKTRSIVVWHKEKVGTFIQLRDTGPWTGVIA